MRLFEALLNNLPISFDRHKIVIKRLYNDKFYPILDLPNIHIRAFKNRFRLISALHEGVAEMETFNNQGY